MSLSNPSLAHVYCSILVCLIIVLLDSLNSSSNLQANYAISFLFRLDLVLYACKILIRCDNFGILNFATKQGLYDSEHFIIFAHLFIGQSSTNKKHQPNIIQIEAQYANEVDQ